MDNLTQKPQFDAVPNLKKEQIGSCFLSLTLDTRKEKKEKECPVCIRITINRESYYYRLGMKCNRIYFSEIDKATGKGRIAKEQTGERLFDTKNELIKSFDAVLKSIKELNNKSALTMDAIKTMLTGKTKNATLMDVWENVMKSKSAGTAASYHTAKQSFIKHMGERKSFPDISVSLVDKWVNKMADAGTSKTTIGIYLRAFRVIVKECINKGYIKEANYPFGKDNNLVSIPKGTSRKRHYLTKEQMTELYNFFLKKEFPESWNKEYTDKVYQSLGLFLIQYLCNGFNLSDAARLQYNSYYFESKGKSLMFCRHKTEDRSDDSEVIIPIIPQLQTILDKIAAPVERGEYVFPYILEGETDEVKRRKKIANENSNIKDRVEKVCEILGWDVKPSCTWCRHSFATNLSYAGVPIKYISESMGHSTKGNVTASYIANFPHERQMEFNSKLLIDEKQDIRSELNQMSIEELRAMLTAYKRK